MIIPQAYHLDSESSDSASFDSLSFGQSKLFRLLTYLLILGLFSSSACAPSKSPDDQIQNLITALQSQEWSKAQIHFSEQFPLTDFPLYQALQQGNTWRSLSKVQYIDHHIIVYIDLNQYDPPQSPTLKPNQGSEKQDRMTSSQIMRFVFWLNQPKYAEYTKAEQSKLAMIKGWLSPQGIQLGQTDQTLLPTRFTNTSYRILAQHQKQAQVASIALGVIGAENSGIIEEGWYGQFELRHPRLYSKQKSKTTQCRRNQKKWDKNLERLNQGLNTTCLNELLFAAQRARYVNPSVSMPRVAISQQEGGKSIRDEQDKKRLQKFLAVAEQDSEVRPSQSRSFASSAPISPNDLSAKKRALVTRQQKENGIDFTGSMNLFQSLSFKAQDRMPPQITEAMIIAPPLTQCIRKITASWSKKSLLQEPCQYEIAIHFTVEERQE
ncbi:MAG: hypothetical protein CMH49_03540 [Myxococcales bacterium]|nr:hypothetical protein [Myxococcales bacterium]